MVRNIHGCTALEAALRESIKLAIFYYEHLSDSDKAQLNAYDLFGIITTKTEHIEDMLTLATRMVSELIMYEPREWGKNPYKIALDYCRRVPESKDQVRLWEMLHKCNLTLQGSN